LEHFLIDNFGLDPRRSLVVANGVDACFFAAGRQENVNYDRDRILVVGGLNDWDGAANVLAAADMLRNQLPRLMIDIVGCLDDKRYVRAAQSRPNIRRLGYVESEQLAAMMPGYLALLYLPNVESFGMVALEAMAAGLPVIACRSTAIPETAGDAALYVEAGSPESIVAAVRHLRDHDSEREPSIFRGRNHSSRYTWHSAIARLTASLEMN
jgi:glycosyltransferase involved in cell wall biosynthesis